MGYSIWLEFEEYANPEDNDDGYCNIAVLWDDGRRQAYNVWTVGFFRENIQGIVKEVEQEGFSTLLPDIIVSTLEREHIADVLKKLLAQ